MAKKILIVEDDHNISELLQLYLNNEGYQTVIANDGGEGIDQFRKFQPDLVLLDIMLPVMDGLEATKRIVAERPVPVLILTARDDEADKVIGLGARHLFVQANQQTAQHADEKRVRQKAKRAVRELGRSDAQRVRNLGP